ncbi:MAG: AAA family ATPase [Actinomycetota bacterium]|nr:AAA family ATPase [Actinomycetota bacterium]
MAAPIGVIALVNQKGGVGKTTVALGLASAAQRSGRSVLVVDIDPQANATTGLGVWESPSSIEAALVQERAGSLADVLVPSGWDSVDGASAPVVQVAPSTPSLAALEPRLAADPVGAQDRLALALDGVRDRFDLVLVDCPPSLGLLTVNGLFAATRALVVTEPAAWAVDGVEQILRTVRRISERRGGVPAVGGIVKNRVARTRDSRYWSDQLDETYGGLVLGTVNQRAAVTEASAQSLPIHGLGARRGAPEASSEFDQLLCSVIGGPSES